MAWHAAGHQELLARGQVGDALGGGGGVGPRPGRELVDEVVPRQDKFLGGDLARLAEGGVAGDGGQALPPGREGRLEDVHDEGVACLDAGSSVWLRDQRIRVDDVETGPQSASLSCLAGRCLLEKGIIGG